LGALYQYIDTSDKRTIVLGDIHGCYDEFFALLEQIKFSEHDYLITTGDFVDRGPATWKVSEFFLNTQNAFSVLGNHERKLAGVIRKSILPAWSQLHSLSKKTEEEWLPWASFFESLPAVIETTHVIVVHARLDPAKDIINQDPYYTCAVGGKTIKIETDELGVPIWFHEWERINKVSKPICMGHIGYDRVILVEKELYALDTGLVRGGPLTAIVFPQMELVRIETGINYFNSSYLEWEKDEFMRTPLKFLPVHKYFELKIKENQRIHEVKAIEDFEDELKSFDFPGKISSLRLKLIELFGMMPESGPGRGEFFKKIKVKLIGINARMVGLILPDKKFNTYSFLKIFEGKTLKEIDEIIEEIAIRLK
jgi:serine/threonine protein phosphatase 1